MGKVKCIPALDEIGTSYRDSWANVMSTNTAWITPAQITVAPGKYLMYISAQFSNGVGMVTASAGISKDSGANSFNDQDITDNINIITMAASATGGGAVHIPLVISVSIETTFYAKVKPGADNPTTWGKIEAIRLDC